MLKFLLNILQYLNIKYS